MRVEQSIDITLECYDGSMQQELSFFGLNSTQLLESEIGERKKFPNKDKVYCHTPTPCFSTVRSDHCATLIECL